MSTYEGPYPAFAGRSASQTLATGQIVSNTINESAPGVPNQLAGTEDDSGSDDAASDELDHRLSIEPEYPERVNNGCQIYKSNCDHDWSRRIGGSQCSKCNVFRGA